MQIALIPNSPRRPRPHEMRNFWFQDDPYIAREALTDAELFYAGVQFLCTPRPFEQVKSLASAAMVAFCADTATEKRTLLRSAFDDSAHENVSHLLFAMFRQYADGRHIDPMLLRFPRLPAPRTGSPRHHWTRTIEPAIRRLPFRHRKDLLTCVYAYFWGFGGYDDLPTPPEWIQQLLQPQEDADPAAPPNFQAVPRVPPG